MAQPAAGKGLVFLSGALPSTVYSGSASDKVLTWIHNGGTLYWAGEALGRYVGNNDKTVREVADYESLFFGVGGCLNTRTEDCRAYSEITDNNYGRHLSLKSNDVRYGVKIGSVPDSLCVGYSEDGYASATLTKCGAGMICVMGGNYSNSQRMDLANIIASGLCYCSSEIGCKEGTVARGTASGSFENMPVSHGNLAVFVYLGGDFSVYGKLYLFSM
jgi:hypothetical protein